VTSAHGDDPINASSSSRVSGVRSITRRYLGVGCAGSSSSSSGERTEEEASIGVGWLSPSNEDGRDGGNGGSVETRSRDVGRDLTAISDEERDDG